MYTHTHIILFVTVNSGFNIQIFTMIDDYNKMFYL